MTDPGMKTAMIRFMSRCLRCRIYLSVGKPRTFCIMTQSSAGLKAGVAVWDGTGQSLLSVSPAVNARVLATTLPPICSPAGTYTVESPRVALRHEEGYGDLKAGCEHQHYPVPASDVVLYRNSDCSWIAHPVNMEATMLREWSAPVPPGSAVSTVWLSGQTR